MKAAITQLLNANTYAVAPCSNMTSSQFSERQLIGHHQRGLSVKTLTLSLILKIRKFTILNTPIILIVQLPSCDDAYGWDVQAKVRF